MAYMLDDNERDRRARQSAAPDNSEERDNGDLILFWTNGDPAVKLQRQRAFFCLAEPGAHPLDVVSVPLTRRDLTALRAWTDRALREFRNGGGS